MKRSQKWGLAGIALIVLAIATTVSPALGGPSLKKLVKKEVAKQIAKATGPAGASGADGIARGYAHIGQGGLDASASKGVVSAVFQPVGNHWCFDLSFVPNIVVATRAYGGASIVNSTGTSFLADAAGCPAPTNDASVNLNSNGTFFVLFN